MEYELIPGSSKTFPESNCYVGVVKVIKTNLDVKGGFEITRHDIPLSRDYDSRRHARAAAAIAILHDREYYIQQHELEYGIQKATQ